MYAIWKKIFSTSSVKIYVIILGLIITAVTARYLGKSGRGQVVLIIQWAQLFFTMAYFSLGQVSFHHLKNNKDALSKVVTSLLSFAIVVSVLCFGIIYILYLFKNDIYGDSPSILFAIGMILIPFLIIEQYSNSILLYIDKLNIYNKYLFISKTISSAVILLLVLLGFGVPGFLIGTMLGTITFAIMIIIYFKRQRIFKWDFDFKTIKTLITKGIQLHITAIGSFLYIKSNILLIGHYMTDDDVGIYDMSVRLINVMMIVPQSALLVSFSQIAKTEAKKMWRDYKKLFFQLNGIMILLAVIAYFLAPIIIKVFAGDEFIPSIKYFRLLLLTTVFMSTGIIVASQIISRGWFKLASISSISLAALNLSLNFILIPKYNLDGAVWATFFTYAASFCINIIILMIINRIEKKESQYSKS